MLRSLHIRNYVLIDSLDITFPEGLVIVTGQTGAGKSILLGALSLLSGGKADAAAISEGAQSCVVEAEFTVGEDAAEIKSIMEEEDLEWDSGHITVRRTVSSSGRSRCFVNDLPVQQQVLAALGERLIDIHSQHQSLLLTDRKFQMGILDSFSGNASEIARCRSLWTSLQACRKKREELAAKLESLKSESDYNSAQLEQLLAARLRPGELEELEEEQKQLSNAELIAECLAGAQASLEGEAGESGVAASLKEAGKLLRKTGEFIPSALDLAQRLDQARIEIEDIEASVEELSEKTDLSSGRLEQVEERMSVLYSLLKKHGCRTVEELVAVRDTLAAESGNSEELALELGSLDADIVSLGSEWAASSSKLHGSRTANAPAFAQEIEKSLKYLELERGVFRVDVLPAPDGPLGADTVSFRFSSTGSEPVDVAKCASGGEISRIMLCLKAMMAKFAEMPTLVFDEIDTGVSGSVADKMGEMICAMGHSMQVFSITHLPQVAAKGDAHYIVSKEFDGQGTRSVIRSANPQERLMEIARLLSGSTVTPAAIENARELLKK